MGAGLIAPFHARALRDCRGGRLVGVCARGSVRAKKLADEYGVREYSTLDQMLEDPDIQVVCVLTPNHLHHDAVMACLAAGRHVLVEKPPAMTLRETDEMIAAADRANLRLACAVQCRVRPAVQAVRHAIIEGRFGRVFEADAIMKWYREPDYYHTDPWRSSRRSGAGVTVQHAFHYLDLLHYLAGPVAEVEGRMTNLAHPSVNLEDTLTAFLAYRNGAWGVVQASTALWPGVDVRIEIHGENGSAIVSGEKIALWKFRDERAEDETIRAIGDPRQATAASGPADFGYADHRTVIQDLIDAIHEQREPVIPVRSVRHTVEIALALYQSAARGHPVKLPIEDDPSIWA